MNKDHFIQSLQGVSPDGPLWQGVLWLIAQNQAADLDAICAPNLTDAEAHRGRGRIGALRDLRTQLDTAMQLAHPS
jgi:hypothetical protein